MGWFVHNYYRNVHLSTIITGMFIIIVELNRVQKPWCVIKTLFQNCQNLKIIVVFTAFYDQASYVKYIFWIGSQNHQKSGKSCILFRLINYSFQGSHKFSLFAYRVHSILEQVLVTVLRCLGYKKIVITCLGVYTID